MTQAAKAKRQNRAITVDFHDEATSSQLRGDGKACIEFVLAFLLGTDTYFPLPTNNSRPLTFRSIISCDQTMVIHLSCHDALLDHA